jgi:hypothetical protein
MKMEEIENDPPKKNEQQLLGVPLTKNHAKQLALKIHRANYRRNHLEYYLLFSKNIHWLIYWPSVVLSAVAGCASFVDFQQSSPCGTTSSSSSSIAWLNIFTGVLAMLASALTAINGAAKFPAREQICREFIAKWGHYADRYTTLLNKRYSDMQETSKIVEQAIEEFSELETQSPDIPAFVFKLYKKSSIAKEIDENHQDFAFDFNSEPELLSPTVSTNSLATIEPVNTGTADNFIPDLQKELEALAIN